MNAPEVLWQRLSIQGEPDLAETILYDVTGERPASDLSLPPLTMTEDPTDLASDLKLGELIGEGGMGRVHRAHQRSLCREVAVKTLKSRVASEGLIFEARVGGRLDHPNVIPIHHLGMGLDGQPALVMKCVNGVNWSDLLEGRDGAFDGLIEGDALTWNLKVLVQVCNALDYAHSKGFVHRDLKPENVMIGRYGEVYVLDWGIAVDLADPPSEIAVVGTPVYMAPEMTLGDASKVSARTDIFLLGAILHELLTGETLHTGKTIMMIMMQAHECDSHQYDPQAVPRELASICQKATRNDPQQRFESVAEFRRALEHYLQHRASWELLKDAQRSLARLRALEGEASQGQDVGQVFAECRFGCQHALKVWEGNEDARAMLCESLMVMARHHLSQGRVSEARGVLSEVVDAPVALEAELERLRETVEAASNQRFADSPQAIRQRILVAVLFLVPIVVLSLILVPVIELGKGSMTAGNSLVSTAAATVLMAALLRIWRKKLKRFQVNYQCLLVGLLAMTSLTGYRFLVWHFQWPVEETMLGDILLVTLALAVVGVFVDKVVGWLVLVQLSAFVLGIAFTDVLLHISAVANVLTLALAVAFWRSKARRMSPTGFPS